MKLSRFQALCSVAVFAMGICTSTGQTNGPAPKNGPRAAPSNGVRASNVRPNNPNPPYAPRGPANVGQRPVGTLPAQMQSQPPTNFRPNYSPLSRRLNPTLAEMRVRQQARADNVEPTNTLLPRSGIVQTPLSITDDQRAVSTDDPKPASDVLVKREISEGLETIDTKHTARNGDAPPIVSDSANREFKQHKVKKNHQGEKNRFSYSDALRRNWHEWHNRDWWKQNCNTIVFVTGGYYFLDAGYWYPAWGYDPLYSYYDYDGPIYTYSNLLPDQVIANVQAALQDAGYYFGAVTGSLSVETRAALANYQRDYGLIITGAIDEPTVESLGLY
ncbi:MAG TPA: peptidoglycan-binding domain-containing protein [Candidatus Udaeobacter sp.]|nr:peptidoglycan-binding domain-containing protein [Candidatus Udaeobacter sp.]